MLPFSDEEFQCMLENENVNETKHENGSPRHDHSWQSQFFLGCKPCPRVPTLHPLDLCLKPLLSQALTQSEETQKEKAAAAEGETKEEEEEMKEAEAEAETRAEVP